MGESSDSDEGGNKSRRGWLRKFSIMKVGPPKHAKPTTETKCLGSGAKVTACRMMSRTAGLEVKKRLERLNEFPLRAFDQQADETKVLANVADHFQETEASEQLETISLKESIIWKAWVRWKEGLRLAHRQWGIGEAAARMETSSQQPILALKLTKGKHEQFKAWTMWYLG